MIPRTLVAFAVAGVVGLAAGPVNALGTVRTVSRAVGEGAGDNFGWSVSPAGDLNGDGADDWLVGAPLADGRAVDSGRAYVFLGGSHLDSIPDLVILGRTFIGHLGTTVAGVGDVNGDGYGDWLVGIPDYDSGTVPRFTGKVWLFYGGAVLNDVFDLELYGLPGVSSFGETMAGLGDVNGDGSPDFAVTGSTAFPESLGASVFFGGPAMTASANLTLDYPSGSRPLSIARGGDINGDGWNDIVMGVSSGFVRSHVRVYYGGPAMDGHPDLKIFPPPPVTNDGFGNSVAGVGDVNGDGYADFLVGVPSATVGGQVGVGEARLFFGGPHPSDVPGLVFSGEAAGDNFGISVAGVGDLDGDGYPDIAVGASRHNGPFIGSGRVYIYFGGPGLDTTPDAIVDGAAAFDGLGLSISGAGNPDQRGGNAMLASAVQNDDGGQNAGSAYLLRLSRFQVHRPVAGDHWIAGGTATVSWGGAELADVDLSLVGGKQWSVMATAVGGSAENSIQVPVPDAVSGLAQIRVRVSGAPAGGGNLTPSTGYFHVTRPAPATPAALDPPLRLGAPGAVRLGASVALGVDWDGDGAPDLIAGDPDAGAGNFSFASKPTAGVMEMGGAGSSPAEHFGASVIDAGDLNGDGLDDLAVGAPSDPSRGTDTGRVLIYWGGGRSSGQPALVLKGLRKGELFGASLAGPGDVNGDGFPDLVVGAPGGTVSGRAYVFYGGPGMDATADITLDSGIGGSFGSTVSGAGDVNGDGLADFLVAAAPFATGSGAGTVHLMFGSRTRGVSGRVILEGERVGDGFGTALTAAGDLDGDGYDDFAVGAPLAIGAGDDAGAVYLYFGGPKFAPVPGKVLRGTAPGEQLGTALAGGVDLNGDGRPDLAIGAPGASTGGPSSGQVLVYVGGDQPSPELSISGAPNEQLGMSLAVHTAPADSSFGLLLAGVPLSDTPPVTGGSVAVTHFARWSLAVPADTTWWVGSHHTLRWKGAMPADVWFTDGTHERQLAAAAGGAADNAVEIQVPGSLPDSGSIELRPASSAVRGFARAPATLFVHRTVSLRRFDWVTRDEGVVLTWDSDPEPGPLGITGYRVIRLPRGSTELAPAESEPVLTTTELVDPTGRAGDTYVLEAVDGYGVEFELGRLTIPAAPSGIRAWPQPAGEDGLVHLAFAAPLRSDGSFATDVELTVFDVRGRVVLNLVSGRPANRAGVIDVDWNGHDRFGTAVGSGIYFARLRSPSAGVSLTRRLVLLDTPVR
jgi:hypothetical protein